jgi:ABC-type Na+ efflux pump permease subunit
LFDPRSSLFTVAKRDLSSLSREKTIVLAICIQLFIAGFSSFLVVGLTSLYDPSSVDSEERLELAVTGEDQEKLVRAAAETDGPQLFRYDDREDAIGAFDSGDVDAVVSVSRSSAGDGTRLRVKAVVPAEDLRTTLIVVQLRELLTALERLERTERAAQLEFTPVEVPNDDAGSSSYFGFTYTILLPLLLFLPPFISGSIVVDSITEEIERGTLELLRVSPVDLIDVVDIDALAMVLLAPVQALLWILLLRANDIAIDHVGTLLVLVTAVATITVVVGVVLGLVTGRRRQAQLLYSVLVILLFGATVLLPEHPARTVALLSADSATTTTFAHVGGFAVAALSLYAVVRRYVGRVDPESL